MTGSGDEFLPEGSIRASNIAIRGGVGPTEDGGFGCAFAFTFELDDGVRLPEIVLFLTPDGLLTLAKLIASEMEGTFLLYAKEIQEQKRAGAKEN